MDLVNRQNIDSKGLTYLNRESKPFFPEIRGWNQHNSSLDSFH